MAALFIAIPVFAFLPQTILWVLRSFTSVYPTSIEEVRAIGFVMIPALYFILRLFGLVLEHGGRHRALKAVAIAVATIALPLSMKSMPVSAREGILSAMGVLGVVDSGNPASVLNARAVLGIAHSTPFYYSTEEVIRWIRGNTPRGTRILTSRDELLLLRDREVIGPRQVAQVPARAGVELPAMSQLFVRTEEAIRSRDTDRVERLAKAYGADFFVVPWRAEGAAYVDQYFSIIAVRKDLGD
jgi:hypothetical protein